MSGTHLDDRVAVVQDLLIGQLLARPDERAVLKLTTVRVHAIARPIRVHEDVGDAHGEGLIVVAAVEGGDGAVRALRGHDGGLRDATKEADDAISGNQWQSVAISGNQWQSGDAIKEADDAISGNQWQSVAIRRRNQRRRNHLSDAIKEADDAGPTTRDTKFPMGWMDTRGRAHRDA